MARKFWTLLLRVIKESAADNITGESAKVAYYAFLSLFPLILVIFALTGIFGGKEAFSWIVGQLQQQVPGPTADFLEGVVREITSQPDAGALGIGIVLTIWSAAGGVSAIGDGLNTVYNVKESRGWVKKKLIVLGLLLTVVILFVGCAVIIVAGPPIIRALGLGGVVKGLRWPAVWVLIIGLFWLLYYFLPDRDQSGPKGKIVIGAVVGALVWLAVTAGFRFYVANFGNYNKAYGSVGVVIVLMLWLYLTALSILFGGEVASVLEGARVSGSQAAEHGD